MKIEPSHIFSMRILMLSSKWAMFELRFLIFFQYLRLKNVIVELRLTVIYLTSK